MSDPDHEMIERVALAILKTRESGCAASWEEGARVAARAAIAAMREPTPEMIGELKKLDPFFRDAGKIWTALIDMILRDV